MRGQRPPGNVHSTLRRRRGREIEVHQEHKTRRAREQWVCRARVAGETTARLRAQARCHVCRQLSHKPEPKPGQPPTAEVAPPLRAVRGYGGPGLVGVRVEVARMQADTAPKPARRRPLQHQRRCRRPRLRRVWRRSGGMGLVQQGGRGEKEPRQGQGREETREDRQRRLEAGQRWCQRRLRGKGRGRGSERW